MLQSASSICFIILVQCWERRNHHRRVNNLTHVEDLSQRMFGPSIFITMKRARWNLVACLVAQVALHQWQEVDFKAGLIGRMHVVESRNRMLQFDIDRSLYMHYSFNPHFHVIAKTSLVQNSGMDYAKLLKMRPQ